jgi:uncharacterized membrane protein
MPPVVVLQKIKAPIDRVFHFIGDVETHPRYAEFCLSVKVTSPTRGAVGTTFHQVHEGGHECDSRIVHWEPYRKIVWHNFVSGQAAPAQVVTYRLEQEGDITHVLHTVESDLYEDQAIHRKGTEDNVRELANLKELLEG